MNSKIIIVVLLVIFSLSITMASLLDVCDQFSEKTNTHVNACYNLIEKIQIKLNSTKNVVSDCNQGNCCTCYVPNNQVGEKVKREVAGCTSRTDPCDLGCKKFCNAVRASYLGCFWINDCNNCH